MATAHGNIIHLSALGSLPSGTPITTVTVMQKNLQGATPYDVTFRGKIAATIHDEFDVGDQVVVTFADDSQRIEANTSRRGVRHSVKAFGQRIERDTPNDEH